MAAGIYGAWSVAYGKGKRTAADGGNRELARLVGLETDWAVVEPRFWCGRAIRTIMIVDGGWSMGECDVVGEEVGQCWKRA